MDAGEEEFLNREAINALTNGYCSDTSKILSANNIDLLSPLLAVDHPGLGGFSVLRSFLTHLFTQNKSVEDLQRPDCSLIFAYAKMSSVVKEALLKYLFEEVKISRLCLLPKALAVASMFKRRSCLIVDSGATATYVWVVLDGRLRENMTRMVQIGGYHVATFLKQAVSWKKNESATVSSLDTSTVKRKCKLSLNVERDHRECKDEPLLIKSQSAGGCGLEMTEVTLSTELFYAPEMMYQSLDLPAMIKEATRDLEADYVKEVFSNILVTGGNSDLQGFSQRLSVDLRDAMPEYAMMINVYPFAQVGNPSWDAVMGAHSVPEQEGDGGGRGGGSRRRGVALLDHQRRVHHVRIPRAFVR